MQYASSRAESHRPTSLLGKIFGVGEQIIKEVADVVDLGWETEYEKTWAAEQDYETEATNLQMLQAIAEDLKGKLEQWSKDDVIFTF